MYTPLEKHLHKYFTRMEYEAKYSGMFAGVEEYELDPFHKETEREISFNTLSNPVGEFYSVGIDQTTGLKKKIADVHRADSRQISFISELEDFLGDSDNYHQASQKFKTFVRHHIKTPRNVEYLIDEFVNSGYIMALERLRSPGSENDLDFYKDYATSHGTTLPQALLFGPNGTARQAFARWRIEELLRGQHRGNYKPENKQMAKIYDKAAISTRSLPEAKNKRRDIKQIDIASDKSKLPAGIESEIVKAFGRERQLYQRNWYKGTKRLSGDLPYRGMFGVTDISYKDLYPTDIWFLYF